MSRERPTVLMAHPGAELFGSDRMLVESARAMVAGGSRVVTVVPSSGPLISELRTHGVEVVVARTLVLRKELLHPRSWGRLVRDLLVSLVVIGRLLRGLRPDAVYVSTITLPLWPPLARMHGARVVSHVHEAEASARTWVSRALYLPHLCAHVVLVNSVFSLRTIERRLPRLAGRCILVPNGVAGPEAFSPAREHLTGALRVTYVGRLSPRKGPDVALDAVLRLGARGRMVELTLVGSVFPGYEWFEEQLRRQAGDAPAAVRVEFAGFHPDVWELLDRTDVLVVPSRYDEPFGNTAVEGVLARRVVIASDTSGLREAAGGYGTTMLVEPGDPDALADALHSAATSWSSLRGGLEADGLVATQRHSPSSYRRAVHSAIAGGR